MILDEFQRALCERLDYTLATMPVHDHLGYEALAYAKMPGPHYYQVLAGLHRVLRPTTYLEIGVRDGRSMQLALTGTRCIGIDPCPQWTPLTPNVSLCKMSSDAFFAQGAANFDLALLDGDHSFSHALRDFENLERNASIGSVVLIHDVIPMDERTSTPVCKTSFWSGDVWRLMAAIVANRKDLLAFTVACPPTGLGIVLGFNEVRGLSEEAVDLAAALPFDPDWAVLSERLNIVANEPAAFAAALQRQRAA